MTALTRSGIAISAAAAPIAAASISPNSQRYGRRSSRVRHSAASGVCSARSWPAAACSEGACRVCARRVWACGSEPEDSVGIFRRLTARPAGCHPVFFSDKAQDGGKWVTLALWLPTGSGRDTGSAGAGCRQGGTHGVEQFLGTPVTGWSAVPGLGAYRDGGTVICELAAQFSVWTWCAATPCAEWRAPDPSAHLRRARDGASRGL